MNRNFKRFEPELQSGNLKFDHETTDYTDFTDFLDVDSLTICSTAEAPDRPYFNP